MALLGAACMLFSGCMQGEGAGRATATPSLNVAATKGFDADAVRLMASCGGYLGAVNRPREAVAMTYRAARLAPSRGVTEADLASKNTEGANLAGRVAGTPAGDKLEASCVGLYRTT